jgi:hypothetical protein
VASSGARGSTWTASGGDFFAPFRPAATYIMKYIIHDWDDDRCVALLGLCREAMAPAGACSWARTSSSPGTAPSWAKLLDSQHAGLLTGKERTKAEFRICSGAPGSRSGASSRPPPDQRSVEATAA